MGILDALLLFLKLNKTIVPESLFTATEHLHCFIYYTKIPWHHYASTKQQCVFLLWVRENVRLHTFAHPLTLYLLPSESEHTLQTYLFKV